MKKFPGKLKKVGREYILTGQQGNWMRENYPTNSNKDLSIIIGIDVRLVANLAKRYDLKKDEEWLYNERLKKINRVTIQPGKGSVTISTKLSRSDYNLLCHVARKNKKNKYVYLQELVRKALQAESPVKDGELFSGKNIVILSEEGSHSSES